MQNWSFGRRLGVGFAVCVALTLLVAVIAISTFRRVGSVFDGILDSDVAVLNLARDLEFIAEQRVAANRGYLLTQEEDYIVEQRAQEAEFAATMTSLERLLPADRVSEIARANASYVQASTDLLEVGKTASPEDIERRFVTTVRPLRRALSAAIANLVAAQEQKLQGARASARAANEQAVVTLIVIGVFAVAFACVVAWLLTRVLTRQIGSAVAQVRSSSTELQAAATQQASGSKEQATAMAEITTTMSELLATSRQIAESARRVASMAQQTAASAGSGSETVTSATEAILGIQQQVQQVVSHMLDLGKKSQQIGVVLDIVSELAEQTNILAINATIEASGAGEAGRRFGVVAEEIRKLADRVSGSAKEIRSLIEEVRGAVNASVMSTETGSKMVDAGAKQFADVRVSFDHIRSSVTTTTEASREIELSTKQQSTAVEQVNAAISGAAQATKETEASSAQTLQTAAQLAELSNHLLRLVQPQNT